MQLKLGPHVIILHWILHTKMEVLFTNSCTEKRFKFVYHYIRLNFKRQKEAFQVFLHEREAGTACEKGLEISVIQWRWQLELFSQETEHRNFINKLLKHLPFKNVNAFYMSQLIWNLQTILWWYDVANFKHHRKKVWLNSNTWGIYFLMNGYISKRLFAMD